VIARKRLKLCKNCTAQDRSFLVGLLNVFSFHFFNNK